MRVEDPNGFDVRYEFDAVGNRRLVDSVYWDGAAGQRGRQTYWYDYDCREPLHSDPGHAQRRTCHQQGPPTCASWPARRATALGYDWLGQRREATYTFKDPAKPGNAGTLIRESYGYSLDGYLQTLHQNGSLKQVRVLDAIGRTTQLVETQNKTSTVSHYDADNRLLRQQFTDADAAAKNSISAYFYYDNTSDGSSSAQGAGMLARVVTRVGGHYTPAPLPPYPPETPIDVGTEDTEVATPQITGGTEVTTTYRYDYWDEAKQSSITQTAATTGQTTLSYNANGHLQQAKDVAAGLTTTYFNSANGLILSRERQQRNSRVGTHFFYYGRRAAHRRRQRRSQRRHARELRRIAGARRPGAAGPARVVQALQACHQRGLRPELRTDQRRLPRPHRQPLHRARRRIAAGRGPVAVG